LYIRVFVLAGYFGDVSKHWIGNRRFRWGYRFFFHVADAAAADAAAEACWQFVRNGITHINQLDKLWWEQADIDWSKPPQDQAWGPGRTIYDHSGMRYSTWSTGAYWSGSLRGGTAYNDYPHPPYLALRWEKHAPTLSGRKHYGYCRSVLWRFCAQSGYQQRSVSLFAMRDIAGAFNFHITQSATISGITAYHSGGTNREILLSYRAGSLSEHSVTEYREAGYVTTARNFSLPVV
jgi:hypothetical protein